MTLLAPPADALVPSWQWFVATWFGTGLVEPLRAGLAITTAAILMLFLSQKNKFAAPFLAIIILVIGIYVASTIGDASGVKDDRRIVIDEVAAFMLGALFFRGRSWIVLAFFGTIFLFIDRMKPWPFYYLEELPSGWGVMADDLAPAIVLGFIFYLVFSLLDKIRNV